MKTITVLLTKYSDWISWIVRHISGNGYTHASLSLEEDEDTYYSFNYRGFCVETPSRHRRRGVNESLCYQLQIPEDSYLEIRRRIMNFKANQERYRYTRLGVLFAVLHIPFCWKDHYICSQFVAELLKDTGAVPLKKDSSAYLPNGFCKELEQFGGLRATQYNVI